MRLLQTPVACSNRIHAVLSHIRLQQTVQHAINRPGNVIRFFVKGYAQRDGERVAQGGTDDFPGSVARVQRTPEDAGLLSIADYPGKQILAVEVERTQESCDLL